MMKVSLSRKWLMAASVLFLAAACQPKESQQQQQQPRESYSRSSQDGGSFKQDRQNDCCPAKECPTDCKKECPKECPQKEPCKPACPCPEKECPCPQEECPSCDTGCCALEPKKESSVMQSSMRVEPKTEAAAPAVAKPVVVKEDSAS